MHIPNSLWDCELPEGGTGVKPNSEKATHPFFLSHLLKLQLHPQKLSEDLCVAGAAQGTSGSKLSPSRGFAI